MKFPSSDHFLNKVNGRKNFRWAFTEYNTAKNGGGRVALSLTVNTVFSVAKQEWHVRICEEDGNYAGACWEGTFSDPYSAAFFISALHRRDRDLPEGKVDES